MTVLPSVSDYPDFGAPSGAATNTLATLQLLNQANVSTGQLDVSQYDSIMVRLNFDSGAATWATVNVFHYRQSNPVPANFMVRDASCLNGSTLWFIMPAAAPTMMFQVLGNNGAANLTADLTVIGRRGFIECPLPTVVINAAAAGVAPFAAANFDGTRGMNGEATVSIETGAGLAARAYLNRLNSLGAFQTIGIVDTVPPHWSASQTFKVDGSQMRVAVQNLGAANQDLAGHLYIA